MPLINGRSVLVVNPSADVYGSDLQLLRTVVGLCENGWEVTVAVPTGGELVERLRASAATVRVMDFPVLRRSDASVGGLVRLSRSALVDVRSLGQVVRDVGPAAVLVNTVTLPLWLLAGRWSATPTICHVHEAEARDPWLLRAAVALPLLAAHVVVVNSRTTLETTCEVLPPLRARCHLVYNGVLPPPHEPSTREPDGQTRVVVIGRVSPRKAPDVALEAVGRLRKAGHDVTINICGTPVSSQEWFLDSLVRRSRQPDLAGAVTFSGYRSPLWPALAEADIVVAPSLGESFGNAVVEGQLALRPVIATAVQGHLETVSDRHTGLLVPPDDIAATAAAIATLVNDRELARRLAVEGRNNAILRFSAQRYQDEMAELVDDVAASRMRTRPDP